MTWYRDDDMQADPSLNLQRALYTIIDTFPKEFSDAWGLDADIAPEGLDPDRWERFCELQRIAERLIDIAKVLVRPRSLPDRDLATPANLNEAAKNARALFQQLADRYPEYAPTLHSLTTKEQLEYDFLLSCIQIQALEFAIWPEQIAERVVQMTEYVTRVRSTRAVQYLGRVSRCFLYDQPAELAVMSRAVLEAILEDVIPEEQLRRTLGIRDRHLTLTDYLRLADGTLLSPTAAKAAWHVKQLGDEAAHVSAEAVGSCSEVLESLVVALRALEEHMRNK